MDDADEVNQDENSTLKVKARSGSAAQINYPMYLYAFSGEGDCAGMQKIASSEDTMELLLPVGTYRIVAVAGVSQGYVLPDNPSIDDVITMKEGNCAQTPMMIGKADVTIGKSGKGVSADVTLAYAVASLSIDLKNVPLGVSGVKVMLSPLYSSLSLGGEYDGQAGKVEVDCTLDTENIWCASSLYVFPGSGTETVCSILLETKEKTETFGYTYDGIPLANHSFNLAGNYNGEVTVGGHFIVKDWEKPINVPFDFGDKDDSDDNKGDEDNNQGDDDIDISSVPELWSLWNNCIVVNIGEPDGEGVDLLLMTTKEWESTYIESESLLDGYATNGIKGWRLPNYEEATYLRKYLNGVTLGALNEKLADNGALEIYDDEDSRYLCYNKDNIIASFRFFSSSKITSAVKNANKIYLLRAVTTYHYSK